ncbi:hypothetical protein FQA39_LY05245 [Lamprigera yunnana]|nr:hypothetical protein FQA39_LY05245 [Lamprigera yunnana]
MPYTVAVMQLCIHHWSILKTIKAAFEFQIILNCDSDHILDILEQANEVKLMEEYRSYIFTSLVSSSGILTQLERK